MPANVLVDLYCPHCQDRFVENAKLVRPGCTAWCSGCGKSFPLDPAQEVTRRALDEARAARRQSRERQTDLQRGWRTASVVARPQRDPPMLMRDVLGALDDLLDRLDALHRRQT